MNIRHILKRIRAKGVDTVEGIDIEVKSFKELTPEFKKMLRRAAVCFANSEGGWIILGVDESTGVIEGCPDVDPTELAGIVFEGTRPYILMTFDEFVTEDGRRVMYGRVPRSPRMHATSEGGRFHRIGKKCLPLYPEEERQALIRKGGLDVSAQLLEGLGPEALDKVAVEALYKLWGERRKVLGTTMPMVEEDRERFLESIGALVRDGEGQLKPNLAACVLLASKEEIEPFIPSRRLVYLLMETETEYMKKVVWDGPTVLAIDEVMELMSRNSGTRSLRLGVVQRDVPDFPPAALREILINAIVHRDYLMNAQIQVQQFKDRVEVTSPGGFIGGVSPDNILHHGPVHRNPKLVELMHHLGLVEEVGVGVNRVYEILLRSGKEPPIYEATEHQVRCVVQGGELDKEFIEYIEELGADGRGITLDELLLLHHIKRHGSIDRGEAARITQRSERIAHEVLSRIVERGVLEQVGRRGGAHYRFTDATAKRLKVIFRELRHPIMGEVRSLAMIHEAAMRMGSLTSRDVQELLGVERHVATDLLKIAVEKGLLRREGKRRWTQYFPLASGVDAPKR